MEVMTIGNTTRRRKSQHDIVLKASGLTRPVTEIESIGDQFAGGGTNESGFGASARQCSPLEVCIRESCADLRQGDILDIRTQGASNILFLRDGAIICIIFNPPLVETVQRCQFTVATVLTQRGLEVEVLLE